MFPNAESSSKTHSVLSQPALFAAVPVPEFDAPGAPTAQTPSLAPPNGAPSQQTHPLAPPASAWPHSGAGRSGAPGTVSVAGMGVGAGMATGSVREQVSSRSAVEFAGGKQHLPDITRKYHLKVDPIAFSAWRATSTRIIWRKDRQRSRNVLVQPIYRKELRNTPDGVRGARKELSGEPVEIPLWNTPVCKRTDPYSPSCWRKCPSKLVHYFSALNVLVCITVSTRRLLAHCGRKRK